ncbi:MAG TPA: metal ABC transporter ATP-binding protein [Vicinamibacterales bacterium]|nr:metal ABC transporter ATP-binding protein [Vicinamibacterales bacterium]
MPDPAQSPESVVLEVSGLSVAFGRTQIFNNLSFHLNRGACLAVVGPNGAGKTVLFRTLIGAIPAQGSVHWAPGIRIGYVPQKLDIVRDVPVTGVDFLRAKLPGRGSAERQIAVALASVDLSWDAARRSIGALSGGQFQRLLVAFALLGNPDVLMLDEPTAGVDEPGQERLNELVHRLQETRALTVLLISHDLSVVYRYATDVLCLGRERVCFGVPRTVLTPDLLNEIYGTPVAFHVHEH